MYQAYLLGSFRVQRQTPLNLPSAAVARSLLAYLLLHQEQPQSRHHLLGHFWPDLPEQQARRALSQALWHIRRALPDLIASNRETVHIPPSENLWVDAVAFRTLVQAVLNAEPQQNGVDELCAALDLYQGELLPGLYDDWLLPLREQLRELYLQALERLVAAEKRNNRYEEALQLALRLAAADPLREAAHREIMRLYVALQRPSAALEQFETCSRLLQEELALQPDAETRALVQAIAAQAGDGEMITAVPFLPTVQHTPLLLDPAATHPLLGRESERKALVNTLSTALEGKGGVALLSGEAGVGKSRLLQEIAQDAAWRSAEVLWGHAQAMVGQPALAPWQQALQSGLTPLRVTQLAGLLDDLWLQVLVPLLPALRAVTLAGQPPPLPPEQQRQRQREALAQLLHAWVQITPLLLILEDLHEADEESLALLVALAPRLQNMTLLILGSYRSHEARSDPLVWEQLRALDRAGLRHRLQLSRLDAAATIALIRHSLGLHESTPLFSERLYRETDGNPLFLLETLRSLYDEGMLRQDQDGGWSTPWDETTADYAELPLPGTVERVIARRLRRLGQAESNLLQAAAVLGQDVDFALLPETAVLSPADTLPPLRTLLHWQMLHETANGYRFHHDKVRQVAYENIPAARRIDLHRRAGRALQAHYPEQITALAHHYFHGQLWSQALHLGQQAGDQAAALYANHEAAAHYGRALTALDHLPPDPARCFTLLLGREAVYRLMGDRAAQAAELDALEALAAANATGQDIHWRIEVALRRAHFGEVTADYPAAIAAAETAVSLAQSIGDVALEGRAFMEWGRALWRQGAYDDARAQLTQVLALAQTRELRHLKADALNNLGNICLYQGDYAPAQTFFEQTLALHRELDNRQGEGNALYNLGYVVHDLGDLTAARDYYQKALRIYREIGFRRGEGSALMIDGIALQNQGYYLDAEAHYKHALHILRDIGDRQGEANCLANVGTIRMLLGDYDVVRPYFQQTLSIHREARDRRGEGVTFNSLSLLAYFLHDFGAAENYARQAHDILHDLGIRYYQSHALVYLGHALAGQGQLDEAVTAYRQAAAIRQELGEPHLVAEVLSGLARVSLAQSDPAQALAYTEQIMSHLQNGSLDGVDEPIRVYLTCYRILCAHHDPRAEAILETAYALLQTWAANINDEAVCRTFLENVAAHRDLLAVYRQRRLPQGQRTVRLPRTAAPLGRPLRDDEYVTITWTVTAPEDEAIEGKVARRHVQLLRLLDEAAQQGAAPTVTDLAAALQVSPATLKRDLAELRRAGIDTPTRRAGRST